MPSAALQQEIDAVDAEISQLLAELCIDPAHCDFLWLCGACQTVNLMPETTSTSSTGKTCFYCRARGKVAAVTAAAPVVAPAPVRAVPVPVVVAAPPAPVRVVAAPVAVVVPSAPAPVAAAPAPVAAAPTPKFYAPAVLDTPASSSSAGATTCSKCFSALPAGGNAAACPKCYAAPTTSKAWPCAACAFLRLDQAGSCPVCAFDASAAASGGKCLACHSALAQPHQPCPVCFFHASSSSSGDGGEVDAWKCAACASLNRASASSCYVCYADHHDDATPQQPQPVTVLASCSACTTPKQPGADEPCAVCRFQEHTEHCAACTSPLASSSATCAVCFYSPATAAAAAPAASSGGAPLSDTLDLSLDGKRESLTGARAEELFSLAAPPHHLQHIRRVRLSSKSFGRDASLVAARYLARMPALEHADFADIIAGRPTDEALEVLRVMCTALPSSAGTLLSLDLSDNALGERAIRVLTPFFQSIASTVESLSFRNDGLSELSLQLLADILVTTSTSRLQALHFESNMSGDGGAKNLRPLFERLGACSSSLPLDFSMVSCRVRSEGSASLVGESLPLVVHRLRSLDLSDCAMGDAGSAALVQLLSSSGGLPQLERLLLKDAGISRKHLAAVIQSLANLPQLRELDLSVLEMSAQDMHALFTVLNNQSNSQLETLNLAENNGQGVKGMSQLFVSRQSLPKLASVDLSMNQLDDAAAGMLLGRVDYRRGVLKRVELNGNAFSAGVVEVLEHKLQGVVGKLDENEEP